MTNIIGDVKINDAHKDILAHINSFSLEGRYPESYAVLPSKAEALAIMKKAEEVFLWLKNKL